MNHVMLNFKGWYMLVSKRPAILHHLGMVKTLIINNGIIYHPCFRRILGPINSMLQFRREAMRSEGILETHGLKPHVSHPPEGSQQH